MSARGTTSVLAAAMCLTNAVKAGVWGFQPDVGVSADYNSNPALLTDVSSTAETHAALIVDGPTSYVGDGFRVSLTPSVRQSDSQGYSSLDSNYQHLTANGEFDTERSILKATFGIAQDSSLLHDYLLSGSAGVKRDSLLTDLDWDRQMSERLEVNTDLNYSRVRYATDSSLNPLVDYKYLNLTPNLSWAQSERGNLTFTASGGRYDSLNGLTTSKSLNAQVGFTQKLSEVWSTMASGGLSRAYNSVETGYCAPYVNQFGQIACTLVQATEKSQQSGTVFSVNLTRTTARWSWITTASRQLTPTGFAFLSRQDSYESKATYKRSERWTFSGDLHRVTYESPGVVGGSNALKATYLTLGANWLWTEHWTLSITASRVIESYMVPAQPQLDLGPYTQQVNNSGVALQVTRQFDFKSLQ